MDSKEFKENVVLPCGLTMSITVSVEIRTDIDLDTVEGDDGQAARLREVVPGMGAPLADEEDRAARLNEAFPCPPVSLEPPRGEEE